MTFFTFTVQLAVFLSCRYSSDPLPPIRLSDVFLSMSHIYHMILFAYPVLPALSLSYLKFYRCLPSSWSPCCQIVHVIHLPHDIIYLDRWTCYVPFMSIFFWVSSFHLVWVMPYRTCDTFITCCFMPFLSHLVCPFHVNNFCIYYFVFVSAISYSLGDKLITSHYVPFLLHLLSSFHVVTLSIS